MSHRQRLPVMTSSLVRTGVALAGIALLAALYLNTQRHRSP
ncbi:MAG: hypothetical protein R2838_22740 [Caldilineaceae bacterium]